MQRITTDTRSPFKGFSKAILGLALVVVVVVVAIAP